MKSVGKRRKSEMGTLGSTRVFHVSHRHLQVLTPGFPLSSVVTPKPKSHTLASLSPCVRRVASSSKSLSIAFSLPDDASSASKVVDIDPSLAVKKKAVEISGLLKGTSIFLVGMNSAIKTKLGKLLADALRYYHFDSDSLVEEACSGGSPVKSFKYQDEEGFRDYEETAVPKEKTPVCLKRPHDANAAHSTLEIKTEVLKQLSSMVRLVVCAGDGAVQSSTNLALLRHGISIWIDVPIEIVAKNMVEEGVRIPATELSCSETDENQLLSHLAMLYEEMRSGYATADASVSQQKVASQLGYDEIDAVTTEDMAMEVLKEIQRLARIKKMMEEAARPF